MLDLIVTERLRNASSQMLTLLIQTVDMNTLFVAINDTKINRIITVYNRSTELLKEGSSPFIESYCSHVCKQDKNVLIIPDTKVNALTAKMTITKDLGSTTFIGVPIALKDGTKVGTVCGITKEMHPFSDTEINALHVAATFLGYVLELEYTNYVDEVTGAYTRRYLQVVFDENVTKQPSISLLYFDLDNFKMINDHYGHDWGDGVLHSVVARVKGFLQNRGLLFRLGGDEFAVLLLDFSTFEEVIPFAHDLLHQFDSPFSVRSLEFSITPSLGIAQYPYCSNNLKELLGHADQAMYAAKKDGGNRVRWYNPEEETKLQEKLFLQTRLREALENDMLELFYQPKIQIQNGSIRSMEALARWKDQDGLWISPERFIPIAEENELIGILGKWVLRTACRQQIEWIKKGHPPIVVSVNVSPKQFQICSMVQIIRDAISETGIDPSHLAIEITEGLLVKNSIDVAEELRQIRSLGVKIAIDDFGKGYSSLSYLRLFEPTHLKIDQSFIKDMLDDTGQMCIVSGIINLAHNLGMKVVAEGVERLEQLVRLAEEGCDLIQGYLISPPLPVHEIERISEWHWPFPESKSLGNVS
ncbi:bifunctional diguanylate cyclase/phosphodiesterase [Ferroacidibacillus organovorans]|uniref:Diguanylate cyclase n=1 Tax=Ferroacidibacillus organovorans TaxID=1765683 RepID=A0A162U031_9BACL|nr:EAL domain-containing protein [Ferroacidibacillus organovorans]KYP81291.1 hypothetical protein AYJ22_07745 [Ferroacidibacillus organovorans]OAG95312.1 hypothetical protein AYW79_01185 [Ferroacidibacillus organovorans]OPG17145.1 hypothetical protein B2M26_02065 [Ferroacidibacillus organovorans]